jgi:hypothetical protein
LKHYENSVGLDKYVDEYNKEIYLYSQQVKEYKEALNSPDKLGQKALMLLNKLPAFQNFMQHNSQLAILFNAPANYGTATALSGLQARSEVQQILQGQIGPAGASGIAAMQANLESAHDQLNRLKDKLSQFGEGGADIDMPDFKPEQQNTKSFFKRLQFGTDLQTMPASYFWRKTTDLGLSVTYLMSNKFDFGAGASYKIGWSQSVSHVKISSEGSSFRFFMDFQLKKTVYLTGGGELNYQQALISFNQISAVNVWNKSGLIGISRIVSLNSKFLKKTKIQLLWDFLYRSQVPETSPFRFRVGYVWH